MLGRGRVKRWIRRLSSGRVRGMSWEDPFLLSRCQVRGLARAVRQAWAAMAKVMCRCQRRSGGLLVVQAALLLGGLEAFLDR
jgi:hypothetical protein